MKMETILYFIAYLILYSFAGWVLESVSKTVEQRKFVNSGFLNGPICPIYGFGAIIMILCLSFLKNNPILLFILSFFILSIWEYFVGVLLEKVFKTKYWDYSHLKFNIQGRVCLKNSLFWGVLGVAFICYIHPFIESYITSISINTLFYIDIITGIVIIVDLIISTIAVTNFEAAIKKVNELGETIKEKLEELKKINKRTKVKTIKPEKTSIENIEKIIRELNIAQAKLKIKIYRQANRLKTAFPSMKSETITSFLNQRIDLKKLKESIKNKE
ncbi:MAG: hypothetical protein GX682_03285 [Clostridiaceae bacterium]|nr:hypothetical protein [Clostridiaceae bacterium]